LVFYAHHFDLGIHDRFYVIFANLKKELVEGQLLKLLPEIRKAIECYNDLYPSMYIEWAETPKEKRKGRKLLNNSSIIHFNRVVSGESEAYSQMDIISLNSKVISAGLSGHVLYIDELQNISYDWVSKQAIPFLASCSGIMLGTGTANNSIDSALYRYYKSTVIPDEYKYVLDWEKVYELKLDISKQHADTYKTTVDREILEKGIKSITIQTEWYCNFNISTDKFLTIEDMRDNNMLQEDIDSNISYFTDKDVYRIGSLDPAITGDRCGFGTAISGYEDMFTWVKAKNFEVIKELDESIDPDDIINKTIEYCVSNKLDYLIIDNTAGQKYLASPLYKRMLKETKTQLVPFDYSGTREKVKMCRYNEGLVAKQSFKILKEGYKLQNDGFKYLLEEIPTLEKKINQDKSYSYKAEGNQKDDFAMVFFMLGYCLAYIRECIENKKEFKIGNHIHRLYYRKWNEEPEQQIEKRKSWLGMYG
jgi:hypothetical protein